MKVSFGEFTKERRNVESQVATLNQKAGFNNEAVWISFDTTGNVFTKEDISMNVYARNIMNSEDMYLLVGLISGVCKLMESFKYIGYEIDF